MMYENFEPLVAEVLRNDRVEVLAIEAVMEGRLSIPQSILDCAQIDLAVRRGIHVEYCT